MKCVAEKNFRCLYKFDHKQLLSILLLFTILVSPIGFFASAETKAIVEPSSMLEPVNDTFRRMAKNGDFLQNTPTTGEINALKAAQLYLKGIPFSFQGLIEQLVYEGYSSEEATYAAKNCEANWKDQALKAALSYLEHIPFSYDGLINQLKYEGYSSEEAAYAADNCNADWNHQATLCAKSYLESMAFSRSDLIMQLEYEGFTHSQAVYGVEKNGYTDPKSEALNSQSAIANDGADELLSDYEVKRDAFVNLFSDVYKNGDELSSTDFIYFVDGTTHNFIDSDFGYHWIGYDATGEIVEEDTANGFATMRGVLPFDSKETVLKKYGYKYTKNFEPQKDIFYQELRKNRGDNDIVGYKMLETCKSYVVYTYNNSTSESYQLVFYFDSKEQFVFCSYFYGEVYKDPGYLTTLKKGDKGAAVSDLQSRLRELGFYTFSVDGDFGNRTVEAIKLFEAERGLKETGIATIELQKMIYSNQIIKYTEHTEEISNVLSDDKIVELPKGLYRSDKTFLRNHMINNISIMKYDLFCYFDIGINIYSAAFRPDSISEITSKHVIDNAQDNRFNCDYTYVGKNRFHCEVSYTDKFDATHHKISFDLCIEGEKFKIEKLTTTEAKGMETIIEGTYSKID